MSRPHHYSKFTAEEIIDRIRNGETLKRICVDPNMPRYCTIRNWIEVYPEFGAAYDDAMIASAAALADEDLNMARDVANDRLITAPEVQAKKLLSDSLRFHAKVRDRARYGDQTKVEHTHRLKPLEQLSDIDLQRIALGESRGPALAAPEGPLTVTRLESA